METQSIYFIPEVIWFFIGLFFLLAELVVPGLIIIFFGVGAWIVALLCLLVNIPFNWQLIIFLGASILSLVLMRKYLRRFFPNEKSMDSGESLEEFVGKKAVAETAMEKEKPGKVSFKGTSWKAETDMPVKKGQTVIITGKESIVLKVKPRES